MEEIECSSEAAQGGGLKVNEDELVAEVRGVGADEWEQAIADAERGLRELARTGQPNAIEEAGLLETLDGAGHR